jgi:hypothetical protein
MFFLKRQLKKLGNSVRMSKTNRAQLWSTLSEAFDEEYSDIPVCSHRFRFASAGLLAIVLMTTMGTGVYAYESPDVVDGHVFYPIKSGIEQMQKSFARSPEARAEFHANMMNRRLNEGEHHFPKRPEKIENFLEKAAVQLELSVEEIENAMSDDEKRADLIEQLSLHNARYEELAARVSDSQRGVGDLPPLRMRIEGGGLSEEENSRLFEIMRRGHVIEGSQ